MQSYVETSRASIQSLLAEINRKPVAIARKGNYMAFLTMPSERLEEARSECAFRVAEYLESKGR